MAIEVPHRKDKKEEGQISPLNKQEKYETKRLVLSGVKGDSSMIV
jgi:hypothetical protein